MTRWLTVCLYLVGLAVPFRAEGATFHNPINPGADPWMVWHDGNYYLTTTQGDCIRMWKSPTVGGLKVAKPTVIWRDKHSDRSKGIWAPEFHLIGGRWYLYYTAMNSKGDDESHRMHVLQSRGKDPLGPYEYKARLFDPARDHYAIDGTVFHKPSDNTWYFVWASHPGHVLTISRMKSPWELTGKSVIIPASGFGCEEVREGPVVLHRNGHFFLVYSACDTGKPDYKLGMLIAGDGADLLSPASWIQHPRPIFERNDDANVYGPGHNGFFQSPDGKEDWIVYHAKTSAAYTYKGRSTRVQKFTWTPEGLPYYGKPISLEQEIDEPGR